MTTPDDRATLAGSRAGRSLSFDRVADTYDATRGGQERADRHAALVAPRLDPALPALEIGVGTGAVALALRRQGFSVTGVDISLRMLRHARQRLGSSLVAGDATRLPIRDASFPQVYAVWVLHLVADVDAAIAEAGRVLAPGGRLVVCPAGGEPAAEPDAVEEITLPLERLAHGGVIGSRPTPERIAESADRAGLEVEAVHQGDAATFEESPAATAERLEQRSFSMCWDIDDATYERVIAPVVAALRALPDADRPTRRFGRREHLVVLRRPRA